MPLFSRRKNSPVSPAPSLLGRVGLPDPPAGQATVVTEWYMYGNDPDAVASRVRTIFRDQSWVQGTYQLVVRGQAFWWNSGQLTEEFLLAPRTPDPGEFAVAWACTVVDDGGNGNAMVAAAGAIRDDKSAAMSFRVRDSYGVAKTVEVP